jgi:E3 ubiquitin-protein ligase DOA10
MQRFINLSLTAVFVIAAAATAQAQTAPPLQSMTTANRSVISDQLSPADLVSLARRGYFKDQGIASYSAFDNAYAAGKITAETLVQGAIANNRINSTVLNNRMYLSAVANQLRIIYSESL